MKIKKRYGILCIVVLLAVLGITVYMFKSRLVAENYNISESANDSTEHTQQFASYTAKSVKEMFESDELVSFAEADVNYNEENDEYEVVLSLETTEEPSSEKIEYYKSILYNGYGSYSLIINGIER